jgi:hypothetical protein
VITEGDREIERERERESPQRSKPEETQKLTTAFRHLLKFSLHNSVEISYYVTKTKPNIAML